MQSVLRCAAALAALLLLASGAAAGGKQAPKPLAIEDLYRLDTAHALLRLPAATA